MTSDHSSEIRSTARDATDSVAAKIGSELLAKALTSTAILVGFLYYIGWVRTNAFYAAFGIDQTMLSFSTQEYLLRGTRAAFGILLWIMAISLLVYRIHVSLNALLRAKCAKARPIIARALCGTIAGLGALLAATAKLLPVICLCQRLPIIFYPVAFTTGISLLAYAFYIFAAPQAASPSPSSRTIRQTTLLLAGRGW